MVEKKRVFEIEGDLVGRYCLVMNYVLCNYDRVINDDGYELRDLDLEDRDTWGRDFVFVVGEGFEGEGFEIEEDLRTMFIGEVKYCDRYYDEVEFMNCVFVLSETARFTPFFRRFLEGRLDLSKFFNWFKKKFIKFYKSGDIGNSFPGNFQDVIESEGLCDLLIEAFRNENKFEAFLVALRLVKV